MPYFVRNRQPKGNYRFNVSRFVKRFTEDLSVLQESCRFFRQAGSFPADQGDMSRLWLATESTDDVGKPVGCRVDKGIVDLVRVSVRTIFDPLPPGSGSS